IITLVYVPLLSLEGTEGKMFRPMAITMASALFGALVFSLAFFPPLLVLFVPPRSDHGPKWIEAVGRAYGRIASRAVSLRLPAFALSLLVLGGAGYAFAGAGADFVPRIFEG